MWKRQRVSVGGLRGGMGGSAGSAGSVVKGSSAKVRQAHLRLVLLEPMIMLDCFLRHALFMNGELRL